MDFQSVAVVLVILVVIGGVLYWRKHKQQVRDKLAQLEQEAKDKVSKL